MVCPSFELSECHLGQWEFCDLEKSNPVEYCLPRSLGKWERDVISGGQG